MTEKFHPKKATLSDEMAGKNQFRVRWAAVKAHLPRFTERIKFVSTKLWAGLGGVAMLLGLVGYNFRDIYHDIPDTEKVVISEGAKADLDRDIKHRELMAELAREKGVPIEHLRPLFDAAEKQPPKQGFDVAIRQAIEAIISKADKSVVNLRGDEAIEEIIRQARAELKELNTNGAMNLLEEKLRKRQKIRQETRLGDARLSTELAEIAKTTFQWDRAIGAYKQAVHINPDEVAARYHIGDIYRLQGDVDSAFEWYVEAKEVAMKTSNQRELAVSFSRLGDIEVERGLLAEAFKYYRLDIKIAKSLAETNEKNVIWQRDLSVSYERFGDFQFSRDEIGSAFEYYQLCLMIRKLIAARNYSNVEGQRDLWVNYNKLGDLEFYRADSIRALKFYHQAKKIAVFLTTLDGSNNSWQRDLSISYDKLGDVAISLGRKNKGIEHYRSSQIIAETLAERDATNSEWQRDLIISHVKLSGAGAKPLENLRKALAIAEALKSAGKLAPVDEPMIENLKKRLATLD